MRKSLAGYGSFVSALAVALACSAHSAARAQPAGEAKGEVFAVDPVHSAVLFRVTHMGVGPFWGRFDAVTGTIALPKDGTELMLDLEVPIGSVDSGSEQLDEHLRGPEFFDTTKYPTASFKSKSAKKTGDGAFRVSGDLTIHGVTKPIEVDARVAGPADSEHGRRFGLETEFVLKRSDFGVSYGTKGGAVGDEVRLIVGLEAVVKSEGPGEDGAGEGGRTGRRNPARLVERLKGMDADKDGKIAKKEVPENMHRLFERLDENKDDVIDAKELEAFEKRAEQRPDRGRD